MDAKGLVPCCVHLLETFRASIGVEGINLMRAGQELIRFDEILDMAPRVMTRHDQEDCAHRAGS